MKNLLAILITFISVYPSNSQKIGDIQMTDCYLDDCSWLENSPPVEFGFITVPENYLKPEGRLIEMAFSIIKARVENPKHDAIIYFEGGWGLPKVQDTKGFMEGYPIIDRDIILFDYRGTGFSEPSLCTNLGEGIYKDILGNLSKEQFEENQIQRFSQCLDSLKIQQIDFLQYSSANEMHDIRMLMDHLDYDSYNLFGMSYGTRRILELLRISDNKVRSVILDSNCPIGTDQTLIGKLSYYYYDAINNVMADCANDEQCNRAFPNLKQRFEQFLTELDEKPLQFKVGGIEVFLNAAELNAILHQLLYDRYYYADFPILLESLINRKTNALVNITDNMKARVLENFNGAGLINYVIDWNIYKPEIQNQYDQFVQGNNGSYEVMDIYLPFFLQDTRFTVDSLNGIPVVSDVPALITAGAYDPITPPSLSEFLVPNFKSSYYYKFPKEGHAVIPSPEGEDLMKQFFENPDVRPNDSLLVALGNNEIIFTTDYYENDKILPLVFGLMWKKNWWLLTGIALIIIVSLINLIVAVARVVRHKTINNPWNGITSLMIIFFFCGLGYFIYASANHEGPLMLFGLVKESKLLFFTTPFIFIMIGLATVIALKKKNHNPMNFISLGSYALFVVVVFVYQLFPNL